MAKVKAMPAAKVNNSKLLAVPFVYAAVLIALAAMQLVGFGGFDFAGINFETQGTAAGIIMLALVEIFALPFLLRLTLSPLARACSALLAMAAPLVLLINAMLIRDQAASPITWGELVLGAVLGLLAIGSFLILDGDRVLRLRKN